MLHTSSRDGFVSQLRSLEERCASVATQTAEIHGHFELVETNGQSIESDFNTFHVSCGLNYKFYYLRCTILFLICNYGNTVINCTFI